MKKYLLQFLRTHHSFRYAIEGIIWSLQNQNNFRVLILISIIALLFSYFLQISEIEWLIILLTIGTGLAIEILNTAFEATLDAVDKTHRLDIKIAKDASAAAMLIFAIVASVVGLMIFVPKIIPLL